MATCIHGTHWDGVSAFCCLQCTQGGTTITVNDVDVSSAMRYAGAMGERARIVSWLRERALTSFASGVLENMADHIERGDHMGGG